MLMFKFVFLTAFFVHTFMGLLCNSIHPFEGAPLATIGCPNLSMPKLIPVHFFNVDFQP